MDSPASSSQGREGGPRKYAFTREGAREREMHLYLPYWGFSDSKKFAQESIGQHPNVSRDNVLTVFAQLAALRMHARRALISLFDKTTQHVVAEATPDLSLRAADGRDQADALWLGVRRLPRKKVTMCYHAVKSFIEEGRGIFVANDLTSDDRFKNHPSVTGHPHNRFYVSVPITSPDDYVIGSLAVLDDRPRDGVTEDQERLLKELSATVMDHLLCQRAMREEYREERMVRALGLFVKGKSDLNEWFDSGDARDKKYGGQMGLLNKRLEKRQVARSTREDSQGARDNKDSKDDKDDDAGQYQDNELSEARSKHRRGMHGSPVQRFKQGGEHEADEAGNDDKPDEKPRKKRPTLSPTTSQLQDSLAPTNVRSVVNRAASMIYQALDVEGAMFIDASVYARRQTVGFTKSKLDNPEAYHGQQSPDIAGAEEPAPSISNPESRSDTDASDDDSQSRSLVLGHYTSTTSEAGVNLDDSHYVSLSGNFINHLIDQYPRGKIFHIEEDGSSSLSYEGLADERSYSRTGNRGATSTEPEKKDIQQETMDIKELMKVLPDARCIAVYPVWDFQRGRWFTVCVVWANDPGRVLFEPKDLTYLAAFSNTVMAEVSRLDLEAADRAKSDFISSISHELRSPLHGLLGTMELLQAMVNSYAQKSLIETVYSCGRTLLDTLNHLLDYAKINTLTRPRPSEKAIAQGSDMSQPQSAVPGSLQIENLSVLVQEVVEGLLAGAEYQRRGASGDSDALAKKEDLGLKNHLITIVDIEWQDSWRFSVYAGAWRRVVMNLFGNALKYTQAGYIRLRMRRDTLLVDGKRTPAIRMTFSDSGRGMSKDFLTNHLYSAFLQEDTTSPGLGVGLHLVHQIIKSLKGQIKFASEVGKGTDVDVVLPIELPEVPSPSSPRSFASLKERLSGMTVSLFTRSSKLGDLGFDPRVFDRIRSSLGRMVSGWFGLRVLTPDELDSTKPDFAIVTEHEYRNYYVKGTNEPKPDSGEIQPALPLIVLPARTSSWKTLGESVEDSVIFLTQPVSPKTLATAFEHCMGQPERSRSSSPRKLPSPVRSVEHAPPNTDRLFEGMVNGEKDQALEPVLGRTVIDEAGQHNVDGDGRKGAKNILLVEDNQVNLKLIEMCVKTSGFSYGTAKNGLEALEKFKTGTYDAVVMDISMPVMDGLTATRQMRAFERKNKRPATTIIILTAVLSASMQHEAMMSGVNLFLTKPTPLKQLKEILRNLYNDALRHHERRRAFNVSELKRLAALAVQQKEDDVASFEKLAEGGFNRSFKITMRDGFQFVARIPYPVTEPKSLLVASESQFNPVFLSRPRYFAWVMEWEETPLTGGARTIPRSFSSSHCRSRKRDRISQSIWKFGRPLQRLQRLRREVYDYQAQSHLEHIVNLEKYLQIASHLIPRDCPALHRPVIRHPDLQPNNIFVSSELEISGLIDWQHSTVLPLFLQCGIPQSLQNYGDEISKSLQVPTLPEDFNELEEIHQVQHAELFRKRQLHYLYVKLTAEKNPEHYNALTYHFSTLRRQVFHRASDPWEGDNMTLKADLVTLSRNWGELTGDARIPCPIFFSRDESSECLRLARQQSDADKQFQACQEATGVANEGWVPVEYYDEAKGRERKLTADALDAAETEEERVRINENWIFDDFCEEDYT
ncbi:hypothetical protein KXX29_001403 [Aspergillus fumigatus]|nr:hypothetical protein KXX29_001403 [Aspergillus fumigatus]KAH3175919.1 hypothetical protein KXW84_001045 [Aspergillus fumigatus]